MDTVALYRKFLYHMDRAAKRFVIAGAFFIFMIIVTMLFISMGDDGVPYAIMSYIFGMIGGGVAFYHGLVERRFAEMAYQEYWDAHRKLMKRPDDQS